MTDSTPSRVQRVRHVAKLRKAEVRRIAKVTPHLLRITLGGDELHDFVSASHDDHVKLFFPLPGEKEPRMPPPPPAPGEAPHRQDSSASRPIARDYTPRHFDNAKGELDIEFVLHGEGPAASWAAQAKVGDKLIIGGPRGSFVVSNDFAWYLMISDETGVPAISRRLEELPPNTRVQVIVEVENADEQPPLRLHPGVEITWLHRNGAAAGRSGLLPRAAAQLQRPEGDGYVWAAGEYSEVAAVRQQLVSAWGLDKSRIRAASYWKHGAVAHHEVMDA